MFIVLEGLDGAGTTSQLSFLQEQLQALGYNVVTTAEPTCDRPIGKLIRKVLKKEDNFRPESLALLFAADRLEHIKDVVLGNNKETVILCDRYLGSSLAYQSGECGYEWVEGINKYALNPDLVLYFAVSLETAAARRGKRGQDEELFENDRDLKNAFNFYQKYLQETTEYPIEIIDAERGIDDVGKQCLDLILGYLQGGRK